MNDLREILLSAPYEREEVVLLILITNKQTLLCTSVVGIVKVEE